MLTAAQLAQACDCRMPRAENWLAPINDAMRAYFIDSPARQAAFLAQIAHESMRLGTTVELWGPTLQQRKYEPPSQKARELGNTQAGDGYLFRGHGLIQITGRGNHAAARDSMRKLIPDTPDFEAQPSRLEAPKWAALSAAWFWYSRDLNTMADANLFETITRRINGGLTGLDDRMKLWAGAKAALGVK